MTTAEANRLAREKGVSRPLYAIVRALVVPFMRVYFRMHIAGAEHIPGDGPAIIAPNHKSFYDSFFLAACTRRHIRFMAKSELIEARYGRLLALFPEGTRVRDPDHLGHPHRGAGRLALDTGAPLVPCAITGTDSLFLGPIPKPRRVQVAFAEPIPVAQLAPTPEVAGNLIEGTLWPEVQDEYRRLRARPTLIAAALAALGIGGGALLRRRRKR